MAALMKRHSLHHSGAGVALGLPHLSVPLLAAARVKTLAEIENYRQLVTRAMESAPDQAEQFRADMLELQARLEEVLSKVVIRYADIGDAKGFHVYNANECTMYILISNTYLSQLETFHVGGNGRCKCNDIIKTLKEIDAILCHESSHTAIGVERGNFNVLVEDEDRAKEIESELLKIL
jgi:hypothetical protein